MAFFQYSAFDPDGMEKKGLIEAATLEEAQRSLADRDLFLTGIKKASFKKEMPRKKELALFTEELLKLLQASLPLYEALAFLKEKHASSKLFFLTAHLSEEVKRGKLLSQALVSFSDSFDVLYISMVESGEKGGHLVRSLNEIVLLLKKELALKKKIFSALAYPAFLAFFCLAVLTVLFFFVLPSMFEIFEGKQLHPLTRLVFGISRFLNLHKTWFVISLPASAAALSGLVFWKKLKRKIFQTRMFSFIFNQSIFKSFFLQAALVRFARTLAFLLLSGVCYLEALKLAKSVCRLAFLEKEIEKAQQKVAAGSSLSAAFARSRQIPPLMLRMIELAEESADMPGMFAKTAEIMEEEMDRKVQKITGYLGPALLLLLGILVGIVVLSVLIPLTDIGAFVN